MLNIHTSFGFYALAIVAGAMLLRTLHVRRVARLAKLQRAIKLR